MNRKQKIIVSITGIFLVLMILVGLTYAYFLTKITGNTNTKSISVSTANLVLEYGENTNVVQGIENAEPGYSVEKIFTATNKGNSTVTYGAALESIVNELSRQEDLVYTLTCTSYLKEGFSLSNDGTITGTVDGTCNGVSSETKFPNTSDLSIMVSNRIDMTHTHAYKLTITYKEMNIDQSEDMNKTFSAKVNIVNENTFNPYSTNKNTLNYQIINSALEGGTNRTTYGSKVTEFTSISGENERVLNTAPDDYGTSYYYRGNVLDNYVTFADKIWRIVRINGDGTIRLVLDDVAKDSSGNAIQSAFNTNTDDNAYVGYMYGTPGSTTYDATHENKNDSAIKIAVDKWYEDNLKTNYENYLADTLFCNDKSLASSSIGDGNTVFGYGASKTYYASEERLHYNIGTTIITTSKPTFECAKGANNTYSRFTVNVTTLSNGNQTNGNLKYPIGLLTADEVAYAGSYKLNQKNNSYYLNNSTITSLCWLSTPFFHNGSSALEFRVNHLQGSITAYYVNVSYSFRPSVNLKASVLISGGDGTKENPYTVKLS